MNHNGNYELWVIMSQCTSINLKTVPYLGTVDTWQGQQMGNLFTFLSRQIFSSMLKLTVKKKVFNTVLITVNITISS